jgi:uncharacterized Zn-finger protein
MVRFVPNPNFGREDIAKAIKGNITCPKCGKKIKIAGIRLENDIGKITCPFCKVVCNLKGIPDKLL